MIGSTIKQLNSSFIVVSGCLLTVYPTYCEFYIMLQVVPMQTPNLQRRGDAGKWFSEACNLMANGLLWRTQRVMQNKIVCCE